MSITTLPNNFFMTEFFDACGEGNLERAIFIYEKILKHLDLKSLFKAISFAFNGNHFSIIKWLYSINYHSSNYNYADFIISYNLSTDRYISKWPGYYKSSDNYQILFLIWILQLACNNVNLEFMDWVFLEILKIIDADYNIADINNIEFWLYDQLDLFDEDYIKHFFETNKFKTIKYLIKILNYFETNNDIYNYKQKYNLFFKEKILKSAFYDISKNKKNILFLFGLIKNRMSAHCKETILYNYIIYSNTKNINMINLFKKIINKTSNKSKFNVIFFAYEQQKHNYTLPQLVELLDFNIYAIYVDNYFEKIINYAIKRGDLITLEYLSNIFYDEMISKKYYKYCFYNACIYGNLKIIQWFLKKFKKNIFFYKDKGFEILCLSRHLKIAHILIDSIFSYQIPEIVVSLLSNGNLNASKIKLVKKLLNKNDDEDNNTPFLCALYYNTIDIALLIKKYTSRPLDGNKILCDLCTNFGETFIECHKCNEYGGCEHDKKELYKRLQIIKWLIESNVVNIDLSCLFNCSDVPAIILKEIFGFNDSTIILYKSIMSSSADEEYINRLIDEGAELEILDDFIFFSSCRKYNYLRSSAIKEYLWPRYIRIIEHICFIQSRYYIFVKDNQGCIEYGKHGFIKNGRNF